MKNKLKAKMKEKGFNQTMLAKAIYITDPTLTSKLNGRTDFNLTDLRLIVKALELTSDELFEIFFSEEERK